MVKKIDTLKELDAALEHDEKLIIVDFFATWCGPCVRIAPKIEEWSTKDFKDTVVFLKVDVDAAEEISEKYEIESMPTFVFFKKGKEVHRVVGANPTELKAAIDKHTDGKSDSEHKSDSEDK